MYDIRDMSNLTRLFCSALPTAMNIQWRSQGGARGGGRSPQSQKKHSLKKAKSVEKLGGGGVCVTSSKLKLIKYVSTEENDDNHILEELDQL